MTRRLWKVTLGGLLAIAAALPAADAAPAGPREDLVLGNIQELASLNPLVVSAATGNAVGSLVPLHAQDRFRKNTARGTVPGHGGHPLRANVRPGCSDRA
ncbi:MAG: hypothetical protein HY660_04495 [Armatimonadetes bacterium]|nr:hypothetical protein [Armatimonadota bacterium]